MTHVSTAVSVQTGWTPTTVSASPATEALTVVLVSVRTVVSVSVQTVVSVSVQTVGSVSVQTAV